MNVLGDSMSWRRFAGAAVTVLLVAGCGSSDTAVDGAALAARLENSLSSGASGLAASGGAKKLSTFLPNVRYVQDDGFTTRGSDLLLVGKITNVSEGAGFVDAVDGPVRRVDFNSPDADWRTVHLTLTVEERWGDKEPANPVVVFLGFGDMTIAEVEAALGSYERVALFLKRAYDIYDYAPDLYVLPNNQQLFGVADARGTLRLPFSDPERAATFLSEFSTLDQLRERASGPGRTVEMTGCPDACHPVTGSL